MQEVERTLCQLGREKVGSNIHTLTLTDLRPRPRPRPSELGLEAGLETGAGSRDPVDKAGTSKTNTETWAAETKTETEAIKIRS